MSITPRCIGGASNSCGGVGPKIPACSCGAGFQQEYRDGGVQRYDGRMAVADPACSSSILVAAGTCGLETNSMSVFLRAIDVLDCRRSQFGRTCGCHRPLGTRMFTTLQPRFVGFFFASAQSDSVAEQLMLSKMRDWKSRGCDELRYLSGRPLRCFGGHPVVYGVRLIRVGISPFASLAEVGLFDSLAAQGRVAPA